MSSGQESGAALVSDAAVAAADGLVQQQAGAYGELQKALQGDVQSAFDPLSKEMSAALAGLGLPADEKTLEGQLAASATLGGDDPNVAELLLEMFLAAAMQASMAAQVGNDELVKLLSERLQLPPQAFSPADVIAVSVQGGASSAGSAAKGA
jgi:hypothetical protein